MTDTARRMSGLVSPLVYITHQGAHDDTGSWCKFYGCTPIEQASASVGLWDEDSIALCAQCGLHRGKKGGYCKLWKSVDALITAQAQEIAELRAEREKWLAAIEQSAECEEAAQQTDSVVK